MCNGGINTEIYLVWFCECLFLSGTFVFIVGDFPGRLRKPRTLAKFTIFPFKAEKRPPQIEVLPHCGVRRITDKLTGLRPSKVSS